MTTPESTNPKISDKKRAKANRPRRSKPVRAGPIRGGSAPQSAQSEPEVAATAQSQNAHSANGQAGIGDPTAKPHNLKDIQINDAVADAVKSSYDVLTETIEQGRMAAKNFRQGDYNYRDVSGDVETISLRMLGLARQLSSTTFDLFEQLIKEISSAGGAPVQGQSPVGPPFWQPSSAPAAQQSTDAPPSSAMPGADLISLTIQFKGNANARAHPTRLEKPSEPMSPDQIIVSSLAPRSGKSKPITEVYFHADLAIGLVATITIPNGQPPGTYVGLIQAKRQDLPLGILAIEITE